MTRPNDDEKLLRVWPASRLTCTCGASRGTVKGTMTQSAVETGA